VIVFLAPHCGGPVAVEAADLDLVALAVAVPLHLAAVSEFRFIPPCSPVTATMVPADDAWLHEPKLDGYRLQLAKHGRTVCLYSRRGHDWGKRLSALVEDLRGIPAYSAVIDGELCFLDPNGAPDFFRLLKSAFGSQGRELVVYAFDLLHLNGRDLTPLPLTERRQLLERLLSRSNVPCLHVVDAFVPQRVSGFEILETLRQPSAVEAILVEVGEKMREPHPADEACRDAHGIYAGLARPIGEGGAVQHHRGHKNYRTVEAIKLPGALEALVVDPVYSGIASLA
jgi:ATP dependent DNA ligase domain